MADSLSPMFDEVRRYVGFDARDAAAIRAVAPRLARHIDRVVDAFYARLVRHQGARSVLRDEAQVARLKSTLRTWLAQFLNGPYDDAYFQTRARIGRTHVRIGLPQRYMTVAMEGFRADLGVALAEEVRDAAERSAAGDAIGKLCAIELAVMLETYQEDSTARVEEAQRAEHDLLRDRLGQAERRNREILEGTRALVIGLDGEGTIRFMNRWAETACGSTLSEVEGKRWEEEFSPPDWRARTRAAIEARLGGRFPEDLVHPLLTRSGEVRWIQWIPAPSVLTESLAVVAVGVDVTAHRELERRVQRDERLAHAGRLAAGLAHEIRNPLNAAMLQLALLELRLGKSDPAAADDVRPIAATVRDELRRLNALLTEFLDFSRPRAPDRSHGDVGALLDDVARLLSPDATVAGTAIEVEPAGVLPAVRFDPERMRQVLFNLVRNAMEAVVARGAGRVTLRARAGTGVVEIEVEDNGPGIPEGAGIFEPFYTTKDSGTGLGLAIVHRIVTEHDGEIRFESRPGRTMFRVSLPT